MERYFYHSFPRSFKNQNVENAKGLAIIKNILEHGLLFTPEVIEFEEELNRGIIFQNRICLTELSPNELPAHAETFGKFSIELTYETIRKIGAIPVIYCPIVNNGELLEGLGAFIFNGIGELHRLMERLKDFQEDMARRESENVHTFTFNGRSYDAQNGAVKNVIDHFVRDSMSYDGLQGVMKIFISMIYPTENLNFTNLLGYYRQREWRIFPEIVTLNKQHISRELTNAEKEGLLEINNIYFSKEIEFPSGILRRVDRARYLDVPGRAFGTFVRRVIVPDSCVGECQSIINTLGLQIEVSSLEEFRSGSDR